MEDEKKTFTGMKENHIEGRNAVLEAFRSGRTIDKLYVLDGCQDGPVRSITREARKHDTIVNYVTKERLDQISETGKHQGVIAVVQHMINAGWKIFWHLQKKRENHRLS